MKNTDFIPFVIRVLICVAIVHFIKINFAKADDMATTPDQWFCTDDQAQRSGNTFSICGVGTASVEGEARTAALHNAIHEFQVMCDLSSDCKGHKVSVEPKRSTCQHTKLSDGYFAHAMTCYRLFVFSIQ